jgi:hypothetical protein
VDLAEVAESPDLDPKPMELGGGRPSEGTSVGGAHLGVPTRSLATEDLLEFQVRALARGELDTLTEALEEVIVPLRTQVHPEQFASGPGVIPESREPSRNRCGVVSGRSGQGRPLDQFDHHVAVPDPPDDAGETLQTEVQRADELPVPSDEEPLP